MQEKDKALAAKKKVLPSLKVGNSSLQGLEDRMKGDGKGNSAM